MADDILQIDVIERSEDDPNDTTYTWRYWINDDLCQFGDGRTQLEALTLSIEATMVSFCTSQANRAETSQQLNEAINACQSVSLRLEIAARTCREIGTNAMQSKHHLYGNAGGQRTEVKPGENSDNRR